MALSSPALTLHHQNVRTCHGVWLRTAKSASNVASGRGHAKTTTCRFSIIPVGRKHHAGSRGRVHPGGLVEAVRRREGPFVLLQVEERDRVLRGGQRLPLHRDQACKHRSRLPISALLSVLFFGEEALA